MQNRDNSLYREFRTKVLRRDGFTCQYPNCGSKKNVKVHHIMRYYDYPLLRFARSNGITLCQKCHVRVTGYEYLYERLFFAIVRKNENNNR